MILIAEGNYKGCGYVDNESEVTTHEDIEALITPEKNTIESESILRAYLLKNTNIQISPPIR